MLHVVVAGDVGGGGNGRAQAQDAIGGSGGPGTTGTRDKGKDVEHKNTFLGIPVAGPGRGPQRLGWGVGVGSVVGMEEEGDVVVALWLSLLLMANSFTALFALSAAALLRSATPSLR